MQWSLRDRLPIVLLLLGGLSLAISFPTGLAALHVRVQAVERLASLSQTVADADAASALLRQAEAAAMAYPDEIYDGPAQQALSEAQLDATLTRLQVATRDDPLLRSHAGALGVLVRLRLDGLSGFMRSPRSETGRAQAQAARIAADQLIAAARQRAAVEEGIASLVSARLDLVFAGFGVALLLVLGGGMLWRAPLTVGARRLRRAASALDVWPEDVPIGLGLLDRDLVVVSANGCLGRLLGAPTPGSAALVGRPLAGAAPAAMARLAPELRRLLEGGAEGSGQELELPASANAEARICLVAIRPIGTTLRGPAGLSLMVMDVTDRVRAQGSNAALARELNHRVKNTFATVQSLAAQTLRGSAGDLQRFSSAFTGRLMALARSHDLSLERGFGAIALSDVAQSALEPFRGGGQIAIAGAADIAVRPPQAQALIMALHELAGNAARYGALSRPEGRVTLRWDHGSEPGEVCLLWQERGGPRLEAPPSRRGFGRRMLERGLAHDLGIAARVTLRFDHQGLSCEINFAPARSVLRAVAA